MVFNNRIPLFNNMFGKQDNIMSRYDALVDTIPDPCAGTSRFEKRLTSCHKKLAGARARKQWQRDPPRVQ